MASQVARNRSRNLTVFVLCLLPSAAFAQSSEGIVGAWIVAALIGLAVNITLTSVWYFLGARLFGKRPGFVNCALAAILPPILLFIVSLVAGIFIQFIAAISTTIGILVLVVVVIYLLVLYVKWVDQIRKRPVEPVRGFLRGDFVLGYRRV